MNRRAATPEQRAQAEERRNRFRGLARQIAAMGPEARAELAARVNPTTVDGHPLSVHNACLLAAQLASVTLVGGFRQWRRAGRRVRKGEHGLALWVPRAVGKAEAEAPEPEATALDIGAERPRFLMGTVFDVSQTEPDGQDVPVEVAL